MKLTLLPTFYLSHPRPPRRIPLAVTAPLCPHTPKRCLPTPALSLQPQKKPALPAGSLNLTLTNLHRAAAFPFTYLSAPTLDPLHRTIQTPSSF